MDREAGRSGGGVGHAIVFWLGLATAIASLLPITLGALVTTLGAGMAFLDWPTSDGRPLVLYPWFDSTGDKFVEHGHRLAGVLVGFMALLLFGSAWIDGVSRLVRVCCSLVLAGVVCQGLLGGMRVLFDKQFIALFHGVFGCVVFSGLWLVVVLAYRSAVAERIRFRAGRAAKLALIIPAVCFMQFMFGSFVRHLGVFVDLHLVGAGLVAVCGVAVVWSGSCNPTVEVSYVRRCFVGSVVCQLVLGAVVWCAKYGFPSGGVVGGLFPHLGVVARSGHTVLGMVVVASAVVWVFDFSTRPSSAGCDVDVV